MDISKTIAEMKQLDGFADNVGMVMVHNGTVRSWSRKNHSQVLSVKVQANHTRIDEICKEFEKREGIFKIKAKAYEGNLNLTDDLLIFIIAGDIRENVKSCFADLLDTIKNEGVVKEEILA